MLLFGVFNHNYKNTTAVLNVLLHMIAIAGKITVRRKWYRFFLLSYVLIWCAETVLTSIFQQGRDQKCVVKWVYTSQYELEFVRGNIYYYELEILLLSLAKRYLLSLRYVHYMNQLNSKSHNSNDWHHKSMIQDRITGLTSKIWIYSQRNILEHMILCSTEKIRRQSISMIDSFKYERFFWGERLAIQNWWISHVYEKIQLYQLENFNIFTCNSKSNFDISKYIH